MSQGRSIDDQLDELARGFESLDLTLDSVCQALREVSPQDAGPTPATVAFEQGLHRLERSLAVVAGQARDAAIVVRGNVGEVE